MKRYSSLNSSMSFWKIEFLSPYTLEREKHLGKKVSIDSLVHQVRFFKDEQSPTFEVSKLLLEKWLII